MLRSGRRRAVETPRNQVDVAVAHRQRIIDLAVVGSATEESKSVVTIDTEVVDLLEFDLGLGRLVVLVRRIGRPTSFGSQHLDCDELVGVGHVRAEKVVDLTGPGASSPDLDPNVLRGDTIRVDPPAGLCRAESNLGRTLCRDPDIGVDRYIGEVGHCAEDIVPPLETERMRLHFDLQAAGEGKDRHLGAPGGELMSRGGRHTQDTKARVLPPCPRRVDNCRGHPVADGFGRIETPRHVALLLVNRLLAGSPTDRGSGPTRRRQT